MRPNTISQSEHLKVQLKLSKFHLNLYLQPAKHGLMIFQFFFYLLNKY